MIKHLILFGLFVASSAFAATTEMKRGAVLPRVRLEQRILAGAAHDKQYVLKVIRERMSVVFASLGVHQELLQKGESFACHAVLRTGTAGSRLLLAWLVLLAVPEVLGFVLAQRGVMSSETHHYVSVLYAVVLTGLFALVYKFSQADIGSLLAGVFALHGMPLIEMWTLLEPKDYGYARQAVIRLCDALATGDATWRLAEVGGVDRAPVSKPRKMSGSLKAFIRVADALAVDPVLTGRGVREFSTSNRKLYIPVIARFREVMKSLASSDETVLHAAVRSLEDNMSSVCLGRPGGYVESLLKDLVGKEVKRSN